MVPSGSMSAIFAVSSAHGFQTMVVEELVLSTVILRWFMVSSMTQALAVSR